MNLTQIILFVVYSAITFISGVGIYNFLNKENRFFVNSSVFLGEAFLLGTIIVVGEMLLLSSFGLYTKYFLWPVFALNLLFILNRNVRQIISDNLAKNFNPSASSIAFILVLAVFFFRNCYFLLDVDSHSMYLFAQRLWLEAKTSFTGTIAYDARIFVPHFNAVLYALGISLFPKETLFPQLINVSFSIAALILLFGYTSYRFNRGYGLAAVFLVLLNRHFFYSGENTCCVINSALVCFLFASVYNFWEARGDKGHYRFFLAIIFLSQLMGNKYQMVFVTVFVLGIAFFVQQNLFEKVASIFKNKKWLTFLVFSIMVTLFWYIRNFIVTGDPVFPILAGNFNYFNWTKEMSDSVIAIWGGSLNPMQILKYFNYLFIWAGVIPLKYVGIAITLLPFIVLLAITRNAWDKNLFSELMFWLSMVIVYVVGLCMAMFVDPRHYGYGAAIFAFSVIVIFDFVVVKVLKINKIAALIVILLLSLYPVRIVMEEGGPYKVPSFRDNLNVILNKVHLEDILRRDFKEAIIASEGYTNNIERAKQSAWYVRPGNIVYSYFWIPTRPQVGLWATTIVKWDSYRNKEAVMKDLSDFGIKWLMKIEDKKLIFISPEEYANEAVLYELYPKKLRYDYGFPEELTIVK